MILELTQPERDLLLELLDHELTDTHGEVRRTQSLQYREELKAEERLLHDLCDRLRHTNVPATLVR
jgi:hypothetical protein